MKRTRLALTVALIAVTAAVIPAQAVPLSGVAAKTAPIALDRPNIELVQHRPHGPGPGPGPRPGPGPHRGHDGGGDGGAVAAGILGGLLLGAIIANQAQQQDVDYCMRRFRSYDPNSGTYVGYDGRRHRCP